MPNICLYFQVHQPYRLRHYTFFEIGESPLYDDGATNREIMRKISYKCYLPMNTLLQKLIQKYKGKFKVAFSISGVALDQMEEYAPEVLDSFKELVKTGCVEILAETDAHSLAFLYSVEEFKRQVKIHDDRLAKIFGVKPKVFRNTELIYNNDLGKTVAEMGYKAVLTEGADHVLGWRSPNSVYSAMGTPKLKLLMKNYRLSDDIAFRFSDHAWQEWPLTADKYASWLHSVKGAGDIVNLFMDYETFGEHQWAESGIFKFMESLPDAVFKDKEFGFITPSEAADMYKPIAAIDVVNFMSWADVERDITAWRGNDMQRDALEAVYQMEDKVVALNDSGVYTKWRRIQCSDHFYYMCTKWFSDGTVHKYFNPYGTPYDAYINYMNVIGDFSLRVDHAYDELQSTTPVKKAASVSRARVAKVDKVAKVAKKTPTKKSATTTKKVATTTKEVTAKADKAKKETTSTKVKRVSTKKSADGQVPIV